jgi:hypothetical protein
MSGARPVSIEARRDGEEWAACSESYARGFLGREGWFEAVETFARGETVRRLNREFRQMVVDNSTEGAV